MGVVSAPPLLCPKSCVLHHASHSSTIVSLAKPCPDRDTAANGPCSPIVDTRAMQGEVMNRANFNRLEAHRTVSPLTSKVQDFVVPAAEPWKTR